MQQGRYLYEKAISANFRLAVVTKTLDFLEKRGSAYLETPFGCFKSWRKAVKIMSEPKELYKDYWIGTDESRAQRAYYDRLYGKVLHRFSIEPGWKIIDVAGGNGQFLNYLGIQNADIIDISESGLFSASQKKYGTIHGDIEKRFPIAECTYDAAFLFEVLEHLRRPNKTLAEVHNVLKSGGVLYVGQPNMRADGVHHVRRYYLKPLLNDLEKGGFKVEWVDYIPAYSMRDSIVSDIKNNPSWTRKCIQSINFCLSVLPWKARYGLAKLIPDRFALLFVIKAIKI